MAAPIIASRCGPPAEVNAIVAALPKRWGDPVAVDGKQTRAVLRAGEIKRHAFF